MPFGDSTFSNAGAAVSDILSSSANAEGMRITAQGTRIKSQGIRLQARGNLVEGENYDAAAKLAHQNEQFTEQSTAINQMQAERKIYQTIGMQRAQVAGGGLASSGSALDLLADSASQGALTHAVTSAQGLITEAGYDQQAKSYENLAGYARYAAGEEMSIADSTDQIANRQDRLADTTERNGKIMAGIHAASAVASVFV